MGNTQAAWGPRAAVVFGSGQLRRSGAPVERSRPSQRQAAVGTDVQSQVVVTSTSPRPAGSPCVAWVEDKIRHAWSTGREPACFPSRPRGVWDERRPLLGSGPICTPLQELGSFRWLPESRMSPVIGLCPFRRHAPRLVSWAGMTRRPASRRLCQRLSLAGGLLIWRIVRLWSHSRRLRSMIGWRPRLELPASGGRGPSGCVRPAALVCVRPRRPMWRLCGVWGCGWPRRIRVLSSDRGLWAWLRVRSVGRVL